jgi:hypothetical protein
VRDREFLGWMLFLVCAVVFLAIGVRDGDALMTTGSVLFLAGCLVFVLPYLRR